jgi:hypothetical protein
VAKDDYIRFRCSTNLKELVGKQAEEKGMNITDYMEYLIRKDGKNMMFVYCTEEENKEFVDKIVNNGIATRIHPDDNMYLLSKVDKIVIGENILEYSYSLEEYLRMCDGGDYVTLIDGLQIGMDDVIETLLEELYQPCNDDGISFAERIYNSDNPYDEIKKLINEFLLIRIDIVMTDIQMKIDLVKKGIEDGTFEWE